ncbi:MAG: DUF1292 domain-containing protein [Clostridia bacterium]|nr:DUF1292 domain-containing protein [Clostridia bacterium]
MEEERDLVTFSDEDGNEFDLEVIDYFDYEGQEYAALIDAEPDEESDEPLDVYIMKIVVHDDLEEFLPADDGLFEELSRVFDERMKECEACDAETCPEECPKDRKKE